MVGAKVTGIKLLVPIIFLNEAGEEANKSRHNESIKHLLVIGAFFILKYGLTYLNTRNE
jgi:hypothetical protein